MAEEQKLNNEFNPFIKRLNKKSKVKKVIGIVSGKGGVGKSLVTGMLATQMENLDKRVAVMDADITGPSIPKLFGIGGVVGADAENNIYPLVSKRGAQIISVNLMMDDPTDPVVWRGPVIAGVVEQFWTDVVWDDVDYMFVDMPPGTGDVPLTVFQSLPIDGIVVVTSPQDLVSMIVGKAVKMADMMHVPVLGLVENMSFFRCPDCGKQHKIFGESHLEELAKKFNIDTICRLPIDLKIPQYCDAGCIEDLDAPELKDLISKIAKM